MKSNKQKKIPNTTQKQTGESVRVCVCVCVCVLLILDKGGFREETTI